MSTKEEMLQLVLLRESLRKQLEEYELLKSIYSMPGEFQSDNPALITVIEGFLNGTRSSVDEKLDFRIKIQMTEKVKVELSVILGKLYPSNELPMFTVRTNSLNKMQETKIKRAIANYIETEVDKSEPYIFQIVSWLQDNIDDIVMTSPSDELVVPSDDIQDIPVVYERVWIWSHHIYSKLKRHDILKLCKNYVLSGFMWPGKPGVICIEGPADNIQEVLRTIKSWQWQKIKIIKVENSHHDKFLRFSGFDEILTSNDGGDDVKMDSGMFFKYLDAHKSSYMKRELFGFD